MGFTRQLSLPESGSCLLLGPRQTGKSTLLHDRLPAGTTWFVDLLRFDTHLHYARNPQQFHDDALAQLDAGCQTIVVDEVQKLPVLLDAVHALIEARGARFVLTGSSARKLRRGGANLLAGRAFLRQMHPLTQQELGPAFDLERALRLGTLPAVWTLDDAMAGELLRAYADTYLREEIQAEAIVRNLGGFARFLDVAAAYSGDLVNFSAVGREAALATRTVQEYYQILDDTLIALTLPPWRRSQRSRLVAHPKVYLFDTGVTNALCSRTGGTPDASLRGRLFEQWFITEFRRMCDYFWPETRLYFWRTNTGAEVDLLVERHGRLRMAIEVKARATVATADLSGLRAFAAEHPEVPQVVAAPVSLGFRLGEAEVWSPRELFASLDKWLG